MAGRDGSFPSESVRSCLFNQTWVRVLVLLRIPSCSLAFTGSACASPTPLLSGAEDKELWGSLGTCTWHYNGQGVGWRTTENREGGESVGGVEHTSLSIQDRRLLPDPFCKCITRSVSGMNRPLQPSRSLAPVMENP